MARAARRQGRDRHADRAPAVHADLRAALEVVSGAILDRRAFIAREHAPAALRRSPRNSACISPTRPSSSGRRPRRNSARSACRRRSGRSPGRAGRRWRASSRSARRRVAGKRVLDFASGSGLVAIAAAKAGAARVEASEIDEFALAAIAMNAARERRRRSACAPGDLIGARRRLGRRARRRRLLPARHGRGGRPPGCERSPRAAPRC